MIASKFVFPEIGIIIAITVPEKKIFKKKNVGDPQESVVISNTALHVVWSSCDLIVWPKLLNSATARNKSRLADLPRGAD